MNIQAEHLPNSAKELLSVISLNAVLTLVQRYGGTRLRIHKQPSTELIALIGTEEATRLSQTYQQLIINVPNCKKALMILRDNDILAKKRGGMTLAALALEYHLTEMAISLALRRAERLEYQRHTEQSNQLSVFEL